MRELKPGDRLRIKSGPFASFVGVVEGVDAMREVVVVRVSVFGRATPVEVAASDAILAKAWEAPKGPLTNLN